MLSSCMFRLPRVNQPITKQSRYVRGAPITAKKTSHAAAISILLSPGLLIIDHIHFQYNGFMYGILVLSIVLARRQSGLLASGITFAILLCFKHIYLYLAPAYFVFLLRVYCLDPRSWFKIRFGKCVKLGLGIGFVFGLAFGPFVYWNQIDQLLSRLFPFSRGLCHAYWAPNIWALYSFADRILIYCKLSSTGLWTVSNVNSGTLLQSVCQPRGHQQCYTRTGWRYIFRRTA
jgi:alpha-1,3-glucosyltransferase